MSVEQIAIIVILVIFGIALLYFFVEKFLKTNKWGSEVIDKLYILQKLNSTKEEIKIKSALIDADKLLDYVLKKKGLKGETMGERLKNAKSFFDYAVYQEIWEAHKLRNKLVHDIDFSETPEKLSKEFWVLRKAIVHLVK